MRLPQLQGKLEQEQFFLYAAADAKYFDQFGIALINSVTRNTPYGIHIHIYNPLETQLEWCRNVDRLSVSWETVDNDVFEEAFRFWSRPTLPEPFQSRKAKMLTVKGNVLPPDELLRNWIAKTYYACMRFVRLAELVQPTHRLLAIDVDGIVRKTFDTDLGSNDVYLYQKEKHGKFAGYLAGAILYNAQPATMAFINELAQVLRSEIEQNNLYWFLDQNNLDVIVPRYSRGLLPINYIDWHMGKDSAIWSAKGQRKELEVFKQEQQKYL